MKVISGTVDGREADLAAAMAIHPVAALEELALRRWLSGDPDGFLEISADDVVYFDPFTERRLNGKAELAAHYAPLRGKIHASRYEIAGPHVHASCGMAVLTYNFISYGGSEDAMRWNCTEVFRLDGQEWRIVQTHWSFIGPRSAT